MNFENFLELFIHRLSSNGIEYCLSRSHKLASEAPLGDLDFIVKKPTVPAILQILSDLENVKVLRKIERGFITSIFLFGIKRNSNNFIEIDLITSLYWKGIHYLDTAVVINNSQITTTYWGLNLNKPHKAHEALILFFECYVKYGNRNNEYWELISSVLPAEENFLAESVSRPLNHLIGNASQICSVSDMDTALTLRTSFLTSLLKTVLGDYQTMCSIGKHYYFELKVRAANAQSVRICFLGPDGAGKSSIIKRVVAGLNSAGHIEIKHLKPQLFFNKRSEKRGVVTEPHALPLRNSFMSNLKILIWFLELWIDHIFFRKSVFTLEIYDRHYYDILVDPTRYRFGGNQRLARKLAELVPTIDLVYTIVGDANKIHSRKQEVEFEELERQLVEYRALELPAKIAMNVANDGELEAAAMQVENSIVDYLKNTSGFN